MTVLLNWVPEVRPRAAIGAVLGIGLAALLGHLVPAAEGLPWIMAPVGASAVLVFAVPASPLAQPWPVVGGSLVSVLAGMAVGKVCALAGVGAPVAVSLAVGCAIAGMALARCTHPPGGAAAILGALAGFAPDAQLPGPLLPLALNVLGVVLIGWIYNSLTGHPWPHRAIAPPAPVPLRSVTYDRADLDAVLADWDERLEVAADDLDALFRAVERRVLQRGEGG
ncbi:HPP family protein [Novosphingobium sp.]|uniref:HPP family protein n=1 Tax=Novosphingobium sp. TaxID=1874826 RepID=UPI002616BB82|nr:HPP family protein [Novosphingobium sp.]